MSKDNPRCKFCNAYIGIYHRSDFCDDQCRKPKRPKVEGVYFNIALGSCAICGDTTDHEIHVFPGSKLGADGCWHGVFIHGWCEEEWLRRHSYNDRRPFPYHKLGDFGKFEWERGKERVKVTNVLGKSWLYHSQLRRTGTF